MEKSTEGNKKIFLSEVNIEETKEDPEKEEEEEGPADQIYSVEQQIPPNDFENPYSVLPKNVVITRVKVSPLIADCLLEKRDSFDQAFEGGLQRVVLDLLNGACYCDYQRRILVRDLRRDKPGQVP